VKKGRGKPVVIHIDRLHKLPIEVGTDNTGCPASDSSLASPPAKRRKASTADTATSTHCTNTGISRPLTRSTDNHGGSDSNVCTDNDSTDTGDVYQLVTASQGTATATAAAAAAAESAADLDRPRPVPPTRATRQQRRPA